MMDRSSNILHSNITIKNRLCNLEGNMTGHIQNYVTMFKKLGIQCTREQVKKNTINWMSHADNTYRNGNAGDMYF